MDLKQLEYFVRVAELGSFSKAALVTRLPQPSMSRHVRSLEIELRETLFERNGRGVELTDAGRRLLTHAVDILESVSRARDDVGNQRGLAVGRVSVGLPPSIGRRITPALIDTFKRRCPGAQLAIVEGLSTHLLEWITTGRVDLALLHHPDPNESIELTPLIDEFLCLVLARDRDGGDDAPPAKPARPAPAGSAHQTHLRARRGSATPKPGRTRAPARVITLAELPRFSLILPDRSHTMRRLLEAHATMSGVALDVAWEVSSIPSIIDLVLAGHGHGILTATGAAISDHADQLIVRRLVKPEIMSRLCLASSRTRRLSPLARQVATMLTEQATALPRG